MSTFEINKIVGAILAAVLFAMVISKVGDGVVHPRKHTAVAIATSGPAKPSAPAAPAEPEKLDPIAPLLASASVESGAKVARKCATCHDLTKAAKKKVGPPLWNIVGHDKGKQDFSYSGTMSSMGGKWGYEELNAFLNNPKGYVKGTKMAFAGVKNAKERADLVAFLRSLADSPAPLP